MHACVHTHTCIITYTCSCCFLPKLVPCVVRYPRAQSREAETHLWAQGGSGSLSQSRSPASRPTRGPHAHGPSTGKPSSAEPCRTNEAISGEESQQCCSPSSAACQALGSSQPLQAPRLQSACRTHPMQPHGPPCALPVAVPAWGTQNYTLLGRSPCFWYSFRLSWVGFFLHC